MPTTPSDGDTVEVYLAGLPAFNTVRFAKSDKDLLFAGNPSAHIQPSAGNLVATYLWTFSATDNCWLQTTQALESDFTSTAFAIRDFTTWGKAAKFNVSGITDGQTRTITVPDANVNLGTLPSVATTDGNNLGGTRCRILGGSNNTVGGTDNVAIGCAGVTLAKSSQVATSVVMSDGYSLNLINWDKAVITGSNLQSGIAGDYSGFSSWPNDLGAAIIPHGVTVVTTGIRGVNAVNSGVQYIWCDGYSTLGARGSGGIGHNPKAILLAGRSATHEVEFIYVIGDYNVYTATRRITIGGGLGTIATARVGTVRTVGTDDILEEYPFGANPTFTITVDLANNLVIPTVGKVNTGQPVIIQTKTTSYYT